MLHSGLPGTAPSGSHEWLAWHHHPCGKCLRVAGHMAGAGSPDSKWASRQGGVIACYLDVQLFNMHILEGQVQLWLCSPRVCFWTPPLTASAAHPLPMLLSSSPVRDMPRWQAKDSTPVPCSLHTTMQAHTHTLTAVLTRPKPLAGSRRCKPMSS
jgi:hypothetical protein